MTKQQFIEYGRLATLAIVKVMTDHQITVLRFRQHNNPEGQIVCGSILQCTDIHSDEVLDHQRLEPLVNDIEAALGQLQKDTIAIQGNYGCYVLPKGCELPAGVQCRLAAGGDNLTAERMADNDTVDITDNMVACNLGISHKNTIHTYITFRE